MEKFEFHTPENSEGATKELLTEIKKNYGFIPNMFAYMATAPITIEAYLALNDFVTKTSFTPAQQQVALLAASVENDCKFCIVAHQAIGKMKNANIQTLTALGKQQDINDKKDYELVNFVRSVVRNRGMQPESDIERFISAGFTKKQVFEVMLIASIKTLSNYINHVVHPEPNKELLATIGA